MLLREFASRQRREKFSGPASTLRAAGSLREIGLYLYTSVREVRRATKPRGRWVPRWLAVRNWALFCASLSGRRAGPSNGFYLYRDRWKIRQREVCRFKPWREGREAGAVVVIEGDKLKNFFVGGRLLGLQAEVPRKP